MSEENSATFRIRPKLTCCFYCDSDICMSHVIFASCAFTDSVRGLLVIVSNMNKK